MSNTIGKTIISKDVDLSTKIGREVYRQNIRQNMKFLQAKLDALGVPSCCHVQDTFASKDKDGNLVIDFFVECDHE